MKKISIVIFLLFIFGLFSCIHEKTTSFKIEGTIEGANDSTQLFLYYLTQNDGIWEEVSNTTFLRDNKFYFEGMINELVAGTLAFDNIEIPLYLEPSIIKLLIDKNKPYDYKTTGLDVEKEDSKLRNLLSDKMIVANDAANKIQVLFNKIVLYENEPDSVGNLMQEIQQLKLEYLANGKKLDSLRLDFVMKNNSYHITPHLIYILSKGNIISNDTVEAHYYKLPEHSKKTLLGRLALDQINETKLTLNSKEILIGDTAPDFLRETTQGEAIKLSDFRNKEYVLLDFWASWCGPCLKEIPQLKKIHDAYSNTGLRIIGVSSDANEKDWLNAIEKHQMNTWHQVLSDSDLSYNYFANAENIGGIYSVKQIPLYILIDKQGVIIAKWNHIDDESLSFINNLFADYL